MLSEKRNLLKQGTKEPDWSRSKELDLLKYQIFVASQNT